MAGMFSVGISSGAESRVSARGSVEILAISITWELSPNRIIVSDVREEGRPENPSSGTHGKRKCLRLIGNKCNCEGISAVFREPYNSNSLRDFKSERAKPIAMVHQHARNEQRLHAPGPE